MNSELKFINEKGLLLFVTAFYSGGCIIYLSFEYDSLKNSHRNGDCFFRYVKFFAPKHYSAKIFSVPNRKL